MTREELNSLPKTGGIYCIKNKLNNKCYIGQAINLQHRLKNHWKHIGKDRFKHLAIYKAINFHGVENFDLTILYNTCEYNGDELKQKLDELEKYYIKKFDSYNNGYNSTLGGDAGVLGYKHTEETKEHLRQVNQIQAAERAKDPNNWIKAKNIHTGEIIIKHSYREMAEFLSSEPKPIRTFILFKRKIFHKTWQIVRYNDNFPDLQSVKQGYKKLEFKDELIEYLKNNPDAGFKDVSKKFDICYKTFNKYKNLYCGTN